MLILYAELAAIAIEPKTSSAANPESAAAITHWDVVVLVGSIFWMLLLLVSVLATKR